MHHFKVIFIIPQLQKLEKEKSSLEEAMQELGQVRNFTLPFHHKNSVSKKKHLNGKNVIFG